MAKKIFISYDYDNDRDYKNMLVAWSKNNTLILKIYNLKTVLQISQLIQQTPEQLEELYLGA